MSARPPYATDEPDSFYETPQPQRRLRQPQPANPNDRTSAYNVYDNYLDPQANRQSGMGALGMGFMNGSVDDDSDDDDDVHRKAPISAQRNQAGPLPSKHVALAAATSGREPSPPPQYIAAPRPGYAAPIAALNLARPQPAQAPAERQRQPALQIGVNQNQNPFISPAEQYGSSTPVPSTPHPLQPPMTPITPVFARPQNVEISFADKKPIMRGDKEGTLLPKRGERGDDFWRRFSVIAHDTEKRKSGSSWLRKTQNGTSRLSRWVWVIGLILAICAAAGIGLGVWVAQHDNSQEAPEAFGGSEGNAAPSNPAGVASSSKGPHVQPTLTVERRAYEPLPTGLYNKRNHSQRRRNYEKAIY